MNRIPELSLLLCLLLLTSGTAAQQDSISLTVIVSGGESSKGQILFSLFTSEENYLSASVKDEEQSVDADGSATIVFDELKVGLYSVSVAYDENNNGKVDTGFLGIPTELVGFSNNARGVFGPPSFDKTSFNLDSDTSITIRVGRARD